MSNHEIIMVCNSSAASFCCITSRYSGVPSVSTGRIVGPGSRLVGETGAYVIFCGLFGCNDGQPACYFHHMFIIMEIM